VSLPDDCQIPDQFAKFDRGDRRPGRVAEFCAPAVRFLENGWFPGGKRDAHGVEASGAAATAVFADRMVFDPDGWGRVFEAAGAVAAYDGGGEVFGDGADAGAGGAFELGADDDRWAIGTLNDADASGPARGPDAV
jgi:hypothetical protein